MKIATDRDMKQLGRVIGAVLKGGECLELLGDVGVGKTTFVQGLAEGLAIDEDVQSPSFTLSREYDARDGLVLAHYDFYRLREAGVMGYELAESLHDPWTITAVEWGETIGAVLPENRVIITIGYSANGSARQVSLTTDAAHQYIKEAVR